MNNLQLYLCYYYFFNILLPFTVIKYSTPTFLYPTNNRPFFSLVTRIFYCLWHSGTHLQHFNLYFIMCFYVFYCQAIAVVIDSRQKLDWIFVILNVLKILKDFSRTVKVNESVLLYFLDYKNIMSLLWKGSIMKS